MTEHESEQLHHRDAEQDGALPGGHTDLPAHRIADMGAERAAVLERARCHHACGGMVREVPAEHATVQRLPTSPGEVSAVPDTSVRVSPAESAAVIKAIHERLRDLDNLTGKLEGTAELAAQPDTTEPATTDYSTQLATLREERRALRAVLDQLA